jgi:D-alanyl-D-alanine carboxypeptidase (penicillin-binding protein 5/6)
MRLISVVMGAASNGARTKASQALLNYGYRYYETRRLYEANATVATAQVWRGAQDSVKIGPAAGAGAITFPRGQFARIKATVDLPTKLEAPVKLGQQIAEARLELDGKLLATIPLLAQEAVDEGSFIEQLIDRARLMMQ